MEGEIRNYSQSCWTRYPRNSDLLPPGLVEQVAGYDPDDVDAEPRVRFEVDVVHELKVLQGPAGKAMVIRSVNEHDLLRIM